jgi:hypothetical protein
MPNKWVKTLKAIIFVKILRSGILETMTSNKVDLQENKNKTKNLTQFSLMKKKKYRVPH